MKWFKHENTYNNPKIEMLTDKHGIVGYGVYFRLLELIASAIEESNQEDWGFLPEIYTNQYLSKKLQVDEKVLEAIFSTCFDLELLEDRENKVFCQKILERCDDYTQRLLKQSEKKVVTKSEESPTKNRIEENRIEEEENINNDQTSDEVSELKKELGIPETPTKGIYTEFQAEAVRIATALGAPKNRYSAYMKVCKEEPRSLVLSAFAFAEDHPIPSARDGMFFFQLNKLKKEREAKSGNV